MTTHSTKQRAVAYPGHLVSQLRGGVVAQAVFAQVHVIHRCVGLEGLEDCMGEASGRGGAVEGCV